MPCYPRRYTIQHHQGEWRWVPRLNINGGLLKGFLKWLWWFLLGAFAAKIFLVWISANLGSPSKGPTYCKWNVFESRRFPDIVVILGVSHCSLCFFSVREEQSLTGICKIDQMICAMELEPISETYVNAGRYTFELVSHKITNFADEEAYLPLRNSQLPRP